MDPRLTHLAWAASVSARAAVCGCGDCRRVVELVTEWRAVVVASRLGPVDRARVRGWYTLAQEWPAEDVADAIVRAVLHRTATLESLGYRVDGWP